MNMREKNYLSAGLTTALAVLSLVVMANANASLISQDLFTTGDGYLTYDSDTGFSWLDLTQTVGQSYNNVLSGYGGFTTSLGFRYATEDEVGRLFSDAGVVQGTIWGYWDFSNPYYSASAALISLLDVTYPYDGLTVGSAGLTGSTTLSTIGSHDYAWDSVNSHADSQAFQAAGTLDDSVSYPTVGSFLVKAPASVPEPATILLMGTGLAGLIGARRKKK